MSSGLEDLGAMHELHLCVAPWQHKLRFPAEITCSAWLHSTDPLSLVMSRDALVLEPSFQEYPTGMIDVTEPAPSATGRVGDQPI